MEMLIRKKMIKKMKIRSRMGQKVQKHSENEEVWKKKK